MDKLYDLDRRRCLGDSMSRRTRAARFLRRGLAAKRPPCEFFLGQARSSDDLAPRRAALQLCLRVTTRGFAPAGSRQRRVWRHGPKTEKRAMTGPSDGDARPPTGAQL